MIIVKTTTSHLNSKALGRHFNHCVNHGIKPAHNDKILHGRFDLRYMNWHGRRMLVGLGGAQKPTMRTVCFPLILVASHIRTDIYIITHVLAPWQLKDNRGVT